MRIVHAEPGDIDAVLWLRREAATWLGERGETQWATDWPSTAAMLDRLRADLAAGSVWLGVDARGVVVATVTVDRYTDEGLWSPEEAGAALFVHRLMVRRAAAGRSYGTALLRFADQLARLAERQWLRLDAWTTNEALHRYYLGQSFRRVRTVEGHPTPSAACFERPVSTPGA